MSTRLLLIRHGETAWNRGKIFRGAHDVPLNDNGRRQARAVARALGSQRIDAACSSPLSRAAETAAIVLDPHAVEAACCDALTDFNYGEWTGLADDVVARKWPVEHRLWLTAPHTVRAPGGEALAEVAERASAAVAEIAREHDGRTVALFAHRVINKVLALELLGLPLERFPCIRQDNCCLNEFEWTERGCIVVTLNDTSHLRQAGAELLTEDF